jgi:hypothetical protein
MSGRSIAGVRSRARVHPMVDGVAGFNRDLRGGRGSDGAELRRCGSWFQTSAAGGQLVLAGLAARGAVFDPGFVQIRHDANFRIRISRRVAFNRARALELSRFSGPFAIEYALQAVLERSALLVFCPSLTIIYSLQTA